MQNISLITILPMLLGGLIIFLYAIKRLSTSLQNIFTSHVENVIKKYTSNLFFSIVIGTVITILLDSSSAVTIITIIFINAGSINFKQAMGIIMGANVGTTFSSQLIAININEYIIFPLIVGFFIWLFSKSSKWKNRGEIMLYFGLLFFGLYTMETSVLPLKNNEEIIHSISQLDTPVKGSVIGGLITLIIQSSSATVGMLIIMAKQQLIDLSRATAIMLGAELGTCSDTLFAIIGSKRDAVRAGVFQLIFNLIPIIICLLLFEYFIAFVEWIYPNTTVPKKIANAHVMFSLFSVFLFLPFTNSIYRFINYIIPNRLNKVK